MKVLIYTHAFMPSNGGVETYVKLLAEGLCKLKDEEDPDIEVTVVTQTPAGKMNDSSMPYQIVRRPSGLALARLVRDADVIHAAGPAFAPLVLGRLFRKPVVVEHSGYQSICPNGMLLFGSQRTLCSGYFMARQYRKCVRCNASEWGWSRSVRNLLLTFPRRWLCSRAARNIGPSRHIASRSALPNTQVVFHGVPSLPVLPPTERNESEPVSFAYVGRLVIEKGIPVLLHASHQLTQRGFDFHVRILGDGPERQNLENLSTRLGLQDRVEFLGSVPLERVSEALGRADAIVMPSVWEDVAPLVAIEQMMRGKLMIASAIGGLGEEVAGVGLTFPAGDAAALANCMMRVLERPQTAIELGKAARTRALELFNRDRMVQGHISVYRQAMQG